MIVCADDFGPAEDINEVIIELAERGRVSAVSCMVLPGARKSDLHALLEIKPPIDVGLHLVFTNGDGFAHADFVQPTFRELLTKSLLGQIDQDATYHVVDQQYRRFQELLGRSPDFVDGHLHAHQFPGVRTAVIRFLQQIDANRRPYVRNNAIPLAKIWKQAVSIAKCFVLSQFGNEFYRRVSSAGLRTNNGFGGVYNYRTYASYPKYLRQFIKHMESHTGILVTHPGISNSWRRAEYDALHETRLLNGRVNRFTQ